MPPNSRESSWVDTTRNEIKKSLARSFLVEDVRKPKVSYHWGTNPLLRGSIFNSVTPRNRFQLILQFVHVADNSQCNANGLNRDRLNKVRAVIQYLVSMLKSVYIPKEHISIDKELLLWKGKLLFKQYIALERAILGMKMFSLCETTCLLYTSPSPRDLSTSRMPSSA